MTDWLRRLRSALVIVTFFCIFLYVLSLNFRPAERMDLLQRAVSESFLPLFKGLSKVTAFADEVIGDYLLLRQIHAENESLREQVTALEQKLIDYQDAYLENLRLRRLLDFKSTIQTETIAAQVVLHDLTGWFQTLMIDKGLRDGIGVDMAVVNDEGVVGRILEVSDRYARVLLITDAGSSIDAVIQRNRVCSNMCVVIWMFRKAIWWFLPARMGCSRKGCGWEPFRGSTRTLWICSKRLTSSRWCASVRLRRC